MILTERTVKIAAETADGQDPAPRMEEMERFFLDRVQSKSCDHPIIDGNDLPVLTSACPAEPDSTFFEPAVMRTDRTNSVLLPCFRSFLF